MLKNSVIPFTIVKENNGDADDIQYTWKKELLSPDKLNYVMQNINLVQELTETLNMSITLSQHSHQVCKTECQIKCPGCGDKPMPIDISCPYCRRYLIQHNSTTVCPSSGTNSYILYELKIEFQNYLHEFSSSYCYEIVCKIPGEVQPDEYLFFCVEPRFDKTIISKKRYVSTAYGHEFNDLSNSNLYFGVRRFNNKTDEMNISALHSVISTLQNTNGKDCKVTLQAKDGQVTVNKSILAQYSNVFRAMFAHDMKEKQDGVIDIADFEAKVIQKMVDYFYTKKLKDTTGITQELFKLAHRYQIHELCHRCEEFYLFNVYINNDYIVEMLELIDLYELEELRKNTENFVKRYEEALSGLPSYQKYLCQSINVSKAVNTLVLADRYDMKDVKTSALGFIKLNYWEMVENKDFLNLFSNSRLMREIYVFCSE